MERIKIERIQLEAEHFAIAALVLAETSGSIIPHTQGYLDVEFKINGVDVPFEKTIKEIYDRQHQEVRMLAAQYAMEQAELKGLGTLQDLIESSRWAIQDKIETVFGVKLEDR